MNFKIVLIEPEIPQNTGNIGRLAACLGVELILVGKLGFSLDEKAIRRAGMDYWFNLQVRLMELSEFLSRITPRTAFISTKASQDYTKIDTQTDMLVFGNESSGLPGVIYEDYFPQLYRIPMKQEARSLNLATSVGAVSYYIAAQSGFAGLV